MGASASQLRRWRRLILVRDSRAAGVGGPRLAICALCGPDVLYRTHQVQAHHIYPKSLYPEKALLLANGVMTCTGHHQGVVHNHNAAVDVKDNSSLSGWRNLLGHFRRLNALSKNRRYNEKNQPRVTP